jgi:Fe2+ transport system protein FeoA
VQEATIHDSNPNFISYILDFVAIAWFNIGVDVSIGPVSEECLTINVIRPAGTSINAKLPVVIWIYGGAFVGGKSGDTTTNGANIVQKSINIGKPVIHVSLNYRLAGFGFMPGKEIKAAGAGNLGLQDQREAMRWVQKYIGQSDDMILVSSFLFYVELQPDSVVTQRKW